jgi:hypothetical protein
MNLNSKVTPILDLKNLLDSWGEIFRRKIRQER